MTSTQHVRVEGTSYQRGRQYGRQAAARVRQNWDWLLHAAHTLVVLEVRQDDGPDFVTVVEGTTVASVLMNLTEKHIWLAAGNPCQAPYEQLDLAL
jgi:predicted secreted hydrolase